MVIGKQVHIEVKDRMKAREPWLEFKNGQRISYVFIQSANNAKGFEKGEDPLFALSEDLPLDLPYYTEHQIRNPLTRLLSIFVPRHEVDALFTARVSVSGRIGARPKGMPGVRLLDRLSVALHEIDMMLSLFRL